MRMTPLRKVALESLRKQDETGQRAEVLPDYGVMRGLERNGMVYWQGTSDKLFSLKNPGFCRWVITPRGREALDGMTP